MSKLYRLAGKNLVLLDEKDHVRPEKQFITDDHPAFAGQRHKVVACDPAFLGEGELTKQVLLGDLGSVERERKEKPDRMQRTAKTRA